MFFFVSANIQRTNLIAMVRIKICNIQQML